MMSTGLLETCREVKYTNTLKKCVKLVINKNYTEMHGQRNIKKYIRSRNLVSMPKMKFTYEQILFLKTPR
jgi:hypothetical protein